MCINQEKYIKLVKTIAYIGLLFSILFSIVLSFSLSANAETIIYDNITSSNYKTVRIVDDINIKYLNEYSYDVYINNSYMGSFKKDELIIIPNNSDITIYVPNNIKTNFDDGYTLGKSVLYIGIMYLFGFGILLIIGIIVFRKLIVR